MSLLGSLIELVLPAACVCCDLGGVSWCPGCMPLPRPVHQTVAQVPVWSAGEYAGPLRTALLAYKERGIRALSTPLAGYLHVAIKRTQLPRAAVLVPVPSRRTAARERGGDHLRRLLNALPVHRAAASALNLTGSVSDSAGLTVEQRRSNLQHAMHAFAPPAALKDRPVVVVDDVVTTGATIAEAIRALTRSGWPVMGVATIASTRRRIPQRAQTTTEHEGLSQEFLTDPARESQKRGLALQ